MDGLRIIFGLGNPGVEYSRTRHNAGYLAVERLAERHRRRWGRESRFHAQVCSLDCVAGKAVLCRPETFMNRSGEAVRSVVAYYKVPVKALLVVTDDADLPLGHIRMRPGGSAGGHHGLESVEQHLGTRDYARLRIGIGRGAEARRNIADYVLAGFEKDEARLLDRVLERAVDQLDTWLNQGIAKAMNQFNGAVAAPDAKDT